MTEPQTGVRFDLSIPELEKTAKKLRRHVITMIATAGSGHPGGSLSAADIVTALYFKVMQHDPKNTQWPDRDRFVLSKGHAAPILYAALAEVNTPEKKIITVEDPVEYQLKGVNQIQVFEKVGLFNPKYFAYLEDVELSERAKRAGIKITNKINTVMFGIILTVPSSNCLITSLL